MSKLCYTWLPMASLYKTYLQREEYIYKKSTFQGFYKSICISPLNWLSQTLSPLSFSLPSLTVQSLLNCSSKMLRLGNRFIAPVLNTMCNYSHLHTIKEFWFFSFSSSLICCLKNSILKNKSKHENLCEYTNTTEKPNWKYLTIILIKTELVYS